MLVSVFVLVSVLFVGAAYGDSLRDRRLRQHGLPVPPRPDDGPRYPPGTFPPRP